MVKSNVKPLVSVIIPAYNASRFIGETIESILNQTYENIEIVIIDDNSTDDTFKIAKEYKNKNPRISVYRNKNNLGIGANRSKGIKLSKGEYICWQDSDDIAFKDRVASQVEYLQAHKDVGVVGGFLEFMTEDGKTLKTRKYHELDEVLRKNIFRYNPVAQPAAMFRSEVYAKVGGYDASYSVSEDLEMLFRVGIHYKFANVQKKVIRYRQLNSSLTRSNLKKMEKATLRLRKHYARNQAYQFSPVDSVYNFAQRISMVMPAQVRFALFQLIRGDK